MNESFAYVELELEVKTAEEALRIYKDAQAELKKEDSENKEANLDDF